MTLKSRRAELLLLVNESQSPFSCDLKRRYSRPPDDGTRLCLRRLLPDHNPAIRIVEPQVMRRQALRPPLPLHKLQVVLQQDLGQRHLDLGRRDVPTRTGVPAVAEGQVVAVRGRVVEADGLWIAGLVPHAVVAEAVERFLRVRVDSRLTIVAVGTEANDRADRQMETV